MHIATILLAFGYLLGPAAFFTQQRPISLSDWTSNSDRETIVTAAADGTPLRGFVYRSARAHGWMVRFYGANGSASTSDVFDRWLTQRYNINVVVVDYRGYGFTPGHPTFARAQDDALRIFDHVRMLANGQPIFLFGGSLGTSMVSYVALHRNVNGLILQGAMSDAHSMVSYWEIAHIGPLGYFVEADADGTAGMANADRLHSIHAPLLVMHGAEDRSISVADARKNYASSASKDKTLLIVKGSPHLVNLNGTHAGEVFGAFLARLEKTNAG